jgi:hypothetical protein
VGAGQPIPGKRRWWRLVVPFLPLVFLVAELIRKEIAGTYAPEPLIMLLWLSLFLGGPVLVVQGARQLRARGFNIRAVCRIWLGMMYFLLAVLMTM